MTTSDIIAHRLINQQISKTKFKKPEEIVAWMVAMQAQEYAMAKWAIGLRLSGSTDAKVEKAFNEGAILRTHLMRPTWHFVTPKDIRWMLALTAPRVNAASAFMYRKLELDNKVFNRSNNVIAKALLVGIPLTRTILKTALEKAKIGAVGFRLGHLLMRAELDGIICSGPRQGKQFTYALLDDRAPLRTGNFIREEALAEFARRYFTSRGPATCRDFAYWSGLTINDARAGAYMLPSHFEHERVGEEEYIFVPPAPKHNLAISGHMTFLMPDYDEYGMGYKDRSAIFNPNSMTTQIRGDNPVYNRMIIIDGKIKGTWKRVLKNNTVIVETIPFRSLSKVKHRAVMKAIQRYRSFAGNDVGNSPTSVIHV